MRIPTQLGYVLSGTATLALLAGCSGGGAGTPATGPVLGNGTTQSISSRPVSGTTSVLRTGVMPFRAGSPVQGFYSEDAAKKGGSAIYVSDATNAVIDVFSTAGKLTATLSGNGLSQPQGLTSDTSGNLYVANTGASDILVYTKGKGTPKSLPDTGNFPVGVSVDGKGNIGVSNICAAPSCGGGTGSVSFYAKGSSKPKTIPGGSISRVYFCAFDDAGNLFVDGQDANGSPIVGEAVGGAKAKSITILKTGNTINFPGGLQVSPTDQIVLDDQSGAALYTYNAPKKGSLGSPVKTTPLSGASDPVTFAFNAKATDAYTADAGLAALEEYKYPAGGASILSAAIPNGGQPIGVAVNPDEQP